MSFMGDKRHFCSKCGGWLIAYTGGWQCSNPGCSVVEAPTPPAARTDIREAVEKALRRLLDAGQGLNRSQESWDELAEATNEAEALLSAKPSNPAPIPQVTNSDSQLAPIQGDGAQKGGDRV